MLNLKKKVKHFIKTRFPFTKEVSSAYREGKRNIQYAMTHKRHFTALLLCVLKTYSALQWCKYKLKREDSTRKIVAISLIEHFGDIVACEPVSRYVRRRYPRAYIVWCVGGPYRELVASNPFIDQVVVLTCLTAWIALTKTTLFDDMVDLQFQDRMCPVCRVPLQKMKGDTGITLENYYRFGGLLSVFSQSAGLPPLDDQPMLYIGPNIRAKVNGLELPDRFIVIHCLSNQASRDWHPQKWYELVERLTAELHCNVVEVGLHSLVDKSFPHYLSLCGQLSLLETAEVIRRAELFIGIDSGPAHLANAVGTFGIILLGHHTVFQRYLPYSGKFARSAGADLIYQDGPVAAISVERVYQAVDARVNATR